MQTFTPDLHDLLIAPPLRIRLVPGASTRLMVSLACVGRTRAKEPPPGFFRMAGAEGPNPVLIVSDQSRNGLNGPGMAQAVMGAIRDTAARCGATRFVAIGNSMGGTMALHLARLTRVDRVIALVPQVSVDPDRVPQESRRSFFRKQIQDFAFAKADALPEDDKLYHATRLPKARRNVQHLVLPGNDHNLARKPHVQGALAGLVAAMMDGKMWQVRRAPEALGAAAPDEFLNSHEKVAP